MNIDLKRMIDMCLKLFKTISEYEFIRDTTLINELIKNGYDINLNYTIKDKELHLFKNGIDNVTKYKQYRAEYELTEYVKFRFYLFINAICKLFKR